MKNFFFSVLMLLAGSTLTAQTPTIAWQNSIGGSGYDNFTDMQPTSDGGYILGGFSESNMSGDKSENSIGENDMWVVKLDASGNIQWQNTIGGNQEDRLYGLQQTSDGGYILGGFSESGISGDKTAASKGAYDYWVLKLDASGNIVWQKTIGGNQDDLLQSLQQTNDGGYILGGQSRSNISGDKTENSQGALDYWVVKLDASGNIMWQNTIGGSDYDELKSVRQTNDGGYIVGGYSSSFAGGDKSENSIGLYDYWVVKLSASGDIQWQNTIGGAGWEELTCVRQTTDGGYILGGQSDSNISGDKTENSQGQLDYWVVKLDAAGNVQWENTIGGNFDDKLFSVRQTSDGGYLLGGESWSSASGDKTENSFGLTDFWVVKLNAMGNAIQWQKDIGGSDYDGVLSLHQLSDGSFVLGGYSQSNISGNKTENSQGWFDYWVVKLSCLLPAPVTFTQTKPSCAGDSNGKLTANPTPVTGHTYLWNTGATTRLINNLTAGTYTVTITKTGTNCQAVYQATLAGPTPVGITFFNFKNPSCTENNGRITASGFGGTGSRTYLWNTGATTPNLINLGAGTYTVTVTDSKGCTASNQIMLATPPPPQIVGYSILPDGTNKWKVFLSGMGASSPFRYQKCPQGDNCGAWLSSSTFRYLVAGSYTFVMRDRLFCTDTVVVDVPGGTFQSNDDRAADQAFNPSSILFPNPASSEVMVDLSEFSGKNCSLRLMTAEGRIIREISNLESTDDVQRLDLQDIETGFYLLQITSGMGETRVEKLIVERG